MKTYQNGDVELNLIHKHEVLSFEPLSIAPLTIA